MPCSRRANGSTRTPGTTWTGPRGWRRPTRRRPRSPTGPTIRPSQISSALPPCRAGAAATATPASSPSPRAAARTNIPIRLWRFSDGLVITDARPPYADLIGSRVDALEGRPIDDVMALVEPLAPRDNPSNLTAYGPLYLRVSELLAGLGVVASAGPATFTVTSPGGPHRDVRIEPISADLDVAWHGGAPMRLPAGTPLWLTRMATPLWWSYLPESRTLYIQYNEVTPGIDALAGEILARAKAGDVDRVVIDLRQQRRRRQFDVRARFSRSFRIRRSIARDACSC